MTYITGPRSLLLPKLPDGSDNPMWDLLNYADLVGIKTTIDGDNASLGPMSDYGVLNLETVSSVVALGCEVTGYPCWIIVDSLDDTVPDVLDTRVAEEGVTLDPLTWSDWMIETMSATIIADVIYVPSDGAGPHLAGTTLSTLSTEGFTLKSLPEMHAIIAEQPSPDVP